jgi:hypothetical protein
MPDSPFDPDNAAAYARWRTAKLAAWPPSPAALVTELAHPDQIEPAEHARMLAACRRANLCIYRAPPGTAGRDTLHTVAGAFGLVRRDGHLCADADGIATLQVAQDARRRGYIPYTDRPINWHTDGYYNPPAQHIRSMMLHCQEPAAEGGENACIDPEIIYLRLRDKNPDYIRALVRPACMTIPANSDETGVLRPAQTGPVFSVDGVSGALHMRYTARRRNIAWADDPLLREALAFLETLLATDAPHAIRFRLEAGQGILCNNVLHMRTGFNDGPAQRRTFYRARFCERIAGT